MGDIKVQRISLQCIDMKRFAIKIAKKSIIQQETKKDVNLNLLLNGYA
jgi:hypothetical protein